MAPTFSLSRLFPQLRNKQPIFPIIKPTAGRSDDQVDVTFEQIERIRQLCPRFRVLVIGRANSGKTTIIQRVCNTNEKPTVRDEWGNKLPASVLDDPTAMRGQHDIKLEITFKKNPGFVFHDSSGFEASSVNELDQVWEYINDRLTRTELKDRLHAIWFCVSTESNRVAFDAELEFFKRKAGNIPVIVLFTKWDGRIVDACSDLIHDQGMELESAMERAPDCAEKVLKEEFIPVFEKTPYPPASYVVLGYMDKPKTKCPDLSRKTADALGDGVLKKLFVSVQTHNIELCIENAIRGVVKRCKQDYEDIVMEIASWLRHVFDDHNYEKFSRSRRISFEEEYDGRYLVSRIVSLLQPAFDNLKQAFGDTPLQYLCSTVFIAIVLARSFDLQSGTTQADEYEAIRDLVNQFLASPQCHAVKTAIASQLKSCKWPKSQDIPKDEKEQVAVTLIKICKDNLLMLERT